MMDRLGRAGSTYRWAIYDRGFSGVTVPVGPDRVVELCDNALARLDETIRASRRPDGLVHSYRLLRFPAADVATLEHLPVMLEGQVAALSPGVLSASEQADLLDALFASELYRSDQRSFVLAPAHRPPAFVDKNVIPSAHVDRNPLLAGLVAGDDRTIVRVDADGVHRFAPGLTTEAELVASLDRLELSERWASLVERCRSTTLDTYEAVFAHRSYLGRSGSMYAYEGIGSIYWHMVTKLLLAVQEAASAAVGARDDDDRDHDVERLVDAYHLVRGGLGFRKSPVEFGAIPIDPYSHTPRHAGAQQPGMTGAVKEEILARPRELCLRVEAGQVVFDALLLDRAELLDEPTSWTIATVEGKVETIGLDTGSLGFTVCGVPVVVIETSGQPSVEVELADETTIRFGGGRVGRDESAAIFGRTGAVRRIRAAVRTR